MNCCCLCHRNRQYCSHNHNHHPTSHLILPPPDGTVSRMSSHRLVVAIPVLQSVVMYLSGDLVYLSKARNHENIYIEWLSSWIHLSRWVLLLFRSATLEASPFLLSSPVHQELLQLRADETDASDCASLQMCYRTPRALLIPWPDQGSQLQCNQDAYSSIKRLATLSRKESLTTKACLPSSFFARDFDCWMNLWLWHPLLHQRCSLFILARMVPWVFPTCHQMLCLALVWYSDLWLVILEINHGLPWSASFCSKQKRTWSWDFCSSWAWTLLNFTSLPTWWLLLDDGKCILHIVEVFHTWQRRHFWVLDQIIILAVAPIRYAAEISVTKFYFRFCLT